MIFADAFGPGLFRLVLACFVVVSHISSLNVGEPAVFVFFMLSGYWVSLMYLHKYAHHPHPVRTFYLSRGLRVWPPYAVAVVLSILATSLVTGSTPYQLFAGLALFGVASHGLDALNVSWALDLELQFYLLLPFALAVIGGWSLGWLFFASLVAAVLGWWLFLTFGLKTVLCYLPTFAVGVLVAVRDITFSPRLVTASTLGFVAIIAVFFANDTLRAFFIKTQPSPFNEEWMTMALMLLLLPFVAWNVRQKSGWLDAHFGNLSYTLYLLHYPVISVTTNILGRDMTIGEKSIYALAVAVVSVFFYIIIDRPSEAFRRRVMKKQFSKASP
ncbi:acyltransferase [Aliiroseovarius sp. S1339]|uniref:acyltransferase family protein n=1 Tax=Aliiroseovarius sp. S1339 TaxID=2936990 RepID=UPI0020C07E8B|nr:acyltransferase [Aliiroseovarius sp. S1339]MCK8465073.1 acyltransferase [Aliiroseovarius sp. S1339]